MDDDDSEFDTGGGISVFEKLDEAATPAKTVITDDKVLRLSLLLYGFVFVIVLFLFGFLRKIFPQAYNVRNRVEKLKTRLAQDQFGFLSWIWRVHDVDEDEFMEECGMDALCSVRLLQFGFRLSLVAVFNMMWLIPSYYTAGDGSPNKNSTSFSYGVAKTTLAHVPSGDVRLYATVLASYVLFGYTMHAILRELEWYIGMRHKFLRKPLPRHYAIFVRNIPPDYRQNSGLAEFFRQCFVANHSSVLEASIPVNTPALEKVEALRTSALAKLEHALARYKLRGNRPRHRESLLSGRTVDSIQFYSELLERLNGEVSNRIRDLEAKINGPTELVLVPPPTNGLVAMTATTTTTTPNDDQVPATVDESKGLVVEYISATSNSAEKQPTPRLGGGFTSFNEAATVAAKAASKAATVATRTTKDALNTAANTATMVTRDVAATAISVVANLGRDGDMQSSGFVVFNRLSTVNAALHMIHHPEPFCMEVLEAPDPEDVCWKNVRRKHQDLELGELLSLVMTVTLCLFWTVPTSFLASMSSATGVREHLGRIDKFLEEYPIVVALIQQLAPLVLVVLNSLLPIIFKSLALTEGHISSGKVNESVFRKAAFFAVIQTFFISAISGSVVQTVTTFLSQPGHIIDFLATSLPDQATYFMQVVLVYTVRDGAFELLRISPIIIAGIRGCIAPGLTEREKTQTYLGLQPLSDPTPFKHSGVAANWILSFMVLFVYAVISPVTALFTTFSFLFLGSMYRHQFIYIYPKNPDSGGKIWGDFIQTLLICMMIAQLTIIGLLGLKKAVKQGPLLIPLLIYTYLFNMYIRQRHFQVASCLPSRECMNQDLERSCSNFDFSFLQGAYTQPSLAAERELHPDPSLMAPPHIPVLDASYTERSTELDPLI